MMKINKKGGLIERIFSEENIFSAIYSMESYIAERNLLDKNDLKLFYKLKDKYNTRLIYSTIKRCRTLLESVLYENNYFEIQVFFKAKKWDEKENRVKCRPIHTASLITQICIVCLLNQIMFKESENGKRELSDLAQLIPNNFYGNITSLEAERIFYDWRIKYKEYTEKVIETYDESVKNHTYKYEVALDLVNFFPSVNPQVLYKFCLDKIGYLYEEELGNLKLVLEKLLRFKVTNLKSKSALEAYYGEYKDTRIYNLGIPQGLPQSYFFGNICMTMISKQFERIFPGKSFFYVDDSVIYTNSDNARKENFYKAIENLNEAINKEMDNYHSSKNKTVYGIEVHSGEKSISSEINSSQNLSKAFLMLVAKEASGVGYDLRSTMNTLEDIVLNGKLIKLEEAVDCELDNLEKYNFRLTKQDVDKKSFCELYKKSLNRYKKFFKYRKYLMIYRNEKGCLELEAEFKKKYFLKKISDGERQEIMKHMDADNFLAEAQLIYESKQVTGEQEEFLKEIKTFEKKLVNYIDDSNLYFGMNFKTVKEDVTEYDSLSCATKLYMQDFSKMSIDNSITYLNEHADNLVGLIGYGQDFDKKICINSNEYKRKIYNACVSRMFNIEVSDNLCIYRKDNRHISYYELCLFSNIRNKNIRINNIEFPNISLKDDKIGYDIYEVLELFVRYVKKPEYVENLILMHKYISSIWKNGSRFLYFYTLHNQEHSIELIKRVVSLCKVIDYFQIKNEDFYILFLSCYLHDVSMAIQPKIDRFTVDNEQTDLLSSEFYMELKKNWNEEFYNKETTKKVMRLAFEMVNGYFEAIARDKHAYDSATFIKNNSDLSLLETTVRQEVASVSEAHAYEAKDVYGLKSKARTECISEKYLMILLRIADLVDGAKDRVSLNILKHNIANMPEESQFHWVTHAITDGVQIYSEYNFDSNNKTDDNSIFVSVLNKKYLHETIIVSIKVNEYNLAKVKCKGCKNASTTLLQDKRQIVVDLGEGKKCAGDKCNFLCKWMMTKNNYLLSELNALLLYFKRNASNLFDTNIQIKIDYSNAQAANSKYYDIVDNKIN